MIVNIIEKFYVYNKKRYFTQKILSVSNDCAHRNMSIHEDQPNLFIFKKDPYDDSTIKAYLVFNKMEYDVDYDYEEDLICDTYEEPNYIEIHYCPICGEKIEFNIEKSEDVTSEVEPLLKELENIDKLPNRQKNSKKYNDKKNMLYIKIQKIMKI